MSQKHNINRRDFLKLGGLAALSLPAINVVGQIGEYTLLESREEYGGFLIRKHTKDNPPYQVDDSIYQRFDAKNTIFGRMSWDADLQAQLMDVKQVANPNEPGFRREEVALEAAAGFLASVYDTGTAVGIVGKHQGLMRLEPFGARMSAFEQTFAGRWDHSHLTDQDIANKTKKVARFFGASLVGIAALDERWIYSGYSGMMDGVTGAITFAEVEEVKLPEGMVTIEQAKTLVRAELEKLEPEALKETIIRSMESLQAQGVAMQGPSPSMMKAMPASQFAGNLPMMFGSIPAGMVKMLAEELGLSFEITTTDPGESAKPRYLEDGTLVIPKTMNRVIVMAFEMDYDTVEAYPTRLGTAAAANAYSRMAFTASTLAEYIRYLGYNAIPCGNNTGLSVPMAIDAGLGELGRQGILITPKYGPRVRLAKVITDLPMATDQPISFGVTEFCEVCMKCAEKCPSQAISYDVRTFGPNNISNNPGVLKWPIDPVECTKGWRMSGGDCGNCIRVCPFNKVEGWLHDATRILLGARSGTLDDIMVKLDDASGYGGEANPEKFWEGENFIHVKG